MEITEGKKAPAFNLATDDGASVRLSQFKDKKVVLYFYPKDNTPGCTREAVDFSAAINKFDKANTVIIGVSRDSAEKHAKFKEKHGLKVILGSDADGTVTEKYGVWVKKKLYGREFMGIERSTFLIDEQGVVRKIWRKVKVNGHSDAVLEAAKAL